MKEYKLTERELKFAELIWRNGLLSKQQAEELKRLIDEHREV